MATASTASSWGDRRRFFLEALRVLRPGGLLLVQTMVGEPPPGLSGTFDPETRCLVHDGVAGRHFGSPASVRAEVVGGGFEILDEWPQPAAEPPENDEWAIAARRPLVRV